MLKLGHLRDRASEQGRKKEYPFFRLPYYIYCTSLTLYLQMLSVIESFSDSLLE